MRECALLVATCDKYEDAWLPFFELLKINWKSCEYPIYFNTETKHCDLHPNIRHFNWELESDCPWSKRMRLALERIEEDYIILLLEDFFLMSDVDNEMLTKCVNWMKADQKVGMISFERNANLDEANEVYQDVFVEKKRGTYYRCTCQAALWRKSTLLACLKDFESPWEFEKYGTIRSNLVDEKFYWQLKDTKPVFDYKWLVKDGYGICAGKWVRGGNEELFEQYGIEVEFTRLGYYEVQEEELRNTLGQKIVFYFKHFERVLDKINYQIKNRKKIVIWYKERKMVLRKQKSHDVNN